MKEKLAELIKKSAILSPKEKDMYRAMLNFLPDKRLEELLAILEKEANIKRGIEEEKEKKMNETTEKYIDEMEEAYEKEKLLAIKATEKDEEEKAEQLISNI